MNHNQNMLFRNNIVNAYKPSAHRLELRFGKSWEFFPDADRACPSWAVGAADRAKFNKLVYRLGSAKKAKVAIANRFARAIYKILGGAKFKVLGYKRGDPHGHQSADSWRGSGI